MTANDQSQPEKNRSADQISSADSIDPSLTVEIITVVGFE